MWTCEQAATMADEWGFNCGPAALCAVTGVTPKQLRPHLGDFERKGYTNPTLMREILDRLGVDYHWRTDSRGVKNLLWPFWGLARVQWAGPWTKPNVPMQARYRHTHWVACDNNGNSQRRIFDINATCVGGWLSYVEWSREMVPWLLRELGTGANGDWWLTHSIEITRPTEVTNG